MEESVAVLGRVLRRPALRRASLAFTGFALAEYGVWVSMLVYAYGHGGTTAAGAVAVLQLVPAACFAPLAARLTDRHGGAFALRAGYAAQAIALALAAAAILAGAAPALAYAPAVIASTAVTAIRPAQASLLAGLVDRPDELTAATVVTGWADSASVLAGPALAGALIAVDGPGLALAAFAGALAAAWVLVQPLHAATTRPLERHAEEPAAAPVLRDDLPAFALVATLAAQFIAIGALDVIAVVLALGPLGLGQSGAGYLTAVFGAGGIAGAAAAAGLVGARTLVRPLTLAALVWAAAYVLLAAFTTLAGALVLLLAAGAARSVLDTGGRALLARITPATWLGRRFGALEGLAMAALAVGSLLVPALVSLGGVDLALITVAGLLALAVLAPLPLLLRADRVAPATDGLRRLRGHRLFAPLPVPMLEELASELVTVHVPPGETVLREGEAGDRFYLVADGALHVTIADEHIRELEPGAGFGEIALLRDVPRTATVSTRDAAVLYALERGPFLAALRPAAL